MNRRVVVRRSLTHDVEPVSVAGRPFALAKEDTFESRVVVEGDNDIARGEFVAECLQVVPLSLVELFAVVVVLVLEICF